MQVNFFFSKSPCDKLMPLNRHTFLTRLSEDLSKRNAKDQSLNKLSHILSRLPYLGINMTRFTELAEDFLGLGVTLCLHDFKQRHDVGWTWWTKTRQHWENKMKQASMLCSHDPTQDWALDTPHEHVRPDTSQHVRCSLANMHAHCTLSLSLPMRETNSDTWQRTESVRFWHEQNSERKRRNGSVGFVFGTVFKGTHPMGWHCLCFYSTFCFQPDGGKRRGIFGISLTGCWSSWHKSVTLAVSMFLDVCHVLCWSWHWPA